MHLMLILFAVLAIQIHAQNPTPAQILKAKQALNAMDSGLVLEVVCTDPGSVRDFQVFSKQSGHKLLASNERENTYTYWLEKK